MKDHLFCKSGFAGHKCNMPHINFALSKATSFERPPFTGPKGVLSEGVHTTVCTWYEGKSMVWVSLFHFFCFCA